MLAPQAGLYFHVPSVQQRRISDKVWQLVSIRQSAEHADVENTRYFVSEYQRVAGGAGQAKGLQQVPRPEREVNKICWRIILVSL